MEGRITEGAWRQDVPQTSALQPLGRVGANNYTHHASEVRDLYCDYFNAVGSVPWQLNIVNRGYQNS